MRSTQTHWSRCGGLDQAPPPVGQFAVCLAHDTEDRVERSGEQVSRETIDAAELAEALGVSTWTIYQSIKDDSCPLPVIRIGRRLVFSRAALQDLLGAGVEESHGYERDAERMIRASTKRADCSEAPGGNRGPRMITAQRQNLTTERGDRPSG